MATETPRSLDWRTWLKMTRPGFLAVTAAAVLLGLATAAACGCGFSVGRAVATMVLALAVHAGANALNDYHDALSGADALNQQGLFPFTGGSRLIQQGVATTAQMRALAWVLLGLAIPSGILLAAHAGGGLIVVGAAGLLLAWAYSAPPFALMTRGLGELAVGMAWWLIVIGADYSQRGAFFVIPAVSAVSFALLVTNILLINGFPDAPSDARAGKRTLGVLLGPRAAAGLYLGIALAAHGWLVASVLLLIPPQRALAGLVSLPLSLLAAGLLWRHAQAPARLRPALALTIAAALLHAVAMAAGVASIRWE